MRGQTTRRFGRRSPRRSGPSRRPGQTPIRWRPLRVETLENRLVLSTFTVTNTWDSGPGSLRWAIDEANAGAGADEIGFNIAGPGPHTIQPLSALPLITDPVLIDGYTQPGAAPNTSPTGQGFNTVLKIELDGSLAGDRVHGLTITGGNSTVRGLVINRFAGSGIVLDGGDHNAIEGNYIGTDVTGTAAAANGIHGVLIYDASWNCIGTDGDGIGDTAEGNLISGNAGSGVAIHTHAANNVVAGNLIGTDVSGAAALGNGRHGVWMDSVRSNLIGTDGDGVADTEERNVISANGESGLFLMESLNGFAGDNVIAGNFIGTDVTGSQALGNGAHGVQLWEAASSNLVGTDGDGVADAAEANVISGNTRCGVEIRGIPNDLIPTDNVVAGNFIGTDLTGTVALGNGEHGVLIGGGAQSNLIGTNGDGVADEAERNLVSGNLGYGIRIEGGGTDFNVVAGNYIGTDVRGTEAVPNAKSGVFVTDDHFTAEGARSTLIGTNGDGVADAVEGNLISGNAGSGVVLIRGAAYNVLAGNFIGTDVTGTLALGNGSHGVCIAEGSPSNRIGTNGDGVADTVERNLISGNGKTGISVIESRNGVGDNVIAGNFIGTDVTGRQALGNGAHGVRLWWGASSNVVGTDGDGVADAAEANVISGNGMCGVEIRGTPSEIPKDNVVAGNFIGTDLTGTVALSNGSHGVCLDAARLNLIGTDGDGVADSEERNVISGNGGTGVFVAESFNVVAGDNVIAGNFIGTDVTGSQALGNGKHGVRLWWGASSNLVGTDGDGVADAAEANVISGNTRCGVEIRGIPDDLLIPTDNVVVGNFIGTDLTGTVALGNGEHGVKIHYGAQGNRIGGAEALPNTIAFNAEAGVAVVGDQTTGNRARGNSIFANGALGIDLGDDGVTPNDPGDADTGPNHLQNFPLITTVLAGTATRVVGTLNSTPNTELTLDFYANAAADPSGYGEGQRWLGSAVLTTDASGDADFDLLLPEATTAGELVTATATDPEGNTSEFSQAEVAELDAAGDNQAPTAIDDAYHVEEDTLLVVGPESGVLVNDSDADGSPATPLTSLRITEINYNPYEPTADELVANPDFDNDDFQFIELENVGDATIDLTGVRFTTGISFDFTGSHVTGLFPGESVLVVANVEAVEARYVDARDVYPPLAGEFSGGLSNDGEQIVLVDSAGNTIQDFVYDDSGDWPASADGHGDTLEVVDVSGDYNDPANWTASDRLGGTPYSGTDQTVHHDVLRVVFVDAPRNGELLLHEDGSLSYAPDDGFVGTDTFTYQATDGQLQSNVATVTIDVSEVLGPITFLEINGLDPSGGDLWYEFSATRDALMTVDARFDGPADAVQLTLYDEDFVELAGSTGSDGNQRIDYPAGPGDTFHLKLSGTSTDVDLRLVNLVHEEGARVNVYGSDRGDWFRFEAEVTPVSSPEPMGVVYRRITINNVPYDFEFPVIPAVPRFSVTFDGGEGEDHAVFHGTGGNDWVKMGPGLARVTGPNYIVRTTSTENATAYANGGRDVAQLFDSLGADSFQVFSDWGRMSGVGFDNTACGFDFLHGYASDDGQTDFAHFNPPITTSDSLVSSGGGRELFRAWPGQACLIENGYYYRAKGFDQVHAQARGSNAVAVIFDSPGPDVFDAYADQAVITYADGKTVRVDDCRWMHAHASPGAVDTANLYDTTADGLTSYNTKFDARAAADGRHCSRMFAGGVGAFYNRVLCFELTRAVCEPGGNDGAWLFDSIGADQFEAYADRGTLTYEDGTVVEARNFRYLHAFARNGGLDTAILHDQTTTGTSLATTLYGYATSALLYTGHHSGLVRAWDFDQTRAALGGGDDYVRLYDDPGLVDRLVVPFPGDAGQAPAKAKLSNDARQLYIDDFARLWAATSEDFEDEAEVDPAYADQVILEGNWVEL